MEGLVHLFVEEEVVKEVGVKDGGDSQGEPECCAHVHEYLVRELHGSCVFVMSVCAAPDRLVLFEETELVLVRWFHNIYQSTQFELLLYSILPVDL